MSGSQENEGREGPRAPGWYPDPWSATGSGERYFDGKRWGSVERPLGRHASVSLDAREHRRRSRRRRPGLIAFLAIGAIAAAGWFGANQLSTKGSRVNTADLGTVADGNTSRPLGETTTTIFGLLGVDYHRGDCVLWDQTPAATQQTHVVPSRT